jgi:alcohol dehydrogenase YqhD (iron-dependent ADH family)
MGSAHVDGLGNRLGPKGLARVNRAVDVVRANQVEGFAMVFGGVVVLGARQIEEGKVQPAADVIKRLQKRRESR